MRCLTVRQPWAWAIAHGGKNIENRTRRVNYRGPLAIHAGQGWSDRARHDQRMLAAVNPEAAPALPPIGTSQASRTHGPEHYALCHVPAYHGRPPRPFLSGHVLATANLVDCHPGTGCCEPWGETSFIDAAGANRTDIWHLVLEEIRPLDRPIPARGALGLWKPDTDLLAELWADGAVVAPLRRKP